MTVVTTAARVVCCGLLVFWVLHAPAAAQDMPDPSLIHGRAIPAPELANGTVTIRVVRENIGNNVEGQEVRVSVGNVTRTAATDSLGRAEFSGLPSGEARAEATVDGERLESQPFAVPTTGGLRVILVAGLQAATERRKQEEAAAAAAPPVKGTVVFGGESRILMEVRDDELWAFYLLDIVNNARARVDIGAPLVIDLPRTAETVTALEGSSPAAQVNGPRITVVGPFASGTTPLRFGFHLPHSSPDLTFEQRFPAALQQVTFGVQKVGNLSIASDQFATVTDVRTEGGTPFALGSGPALPAGTPLIVRLSNLPVRSQLSRYVALSIAVVVVALGVWLAVTARATSGHDRQALTKRRDELLTDLAQLEARHRRGDIANERYLARRQRLIADLEQVYGELDDAGAGPQGGGEGIAA